MTDSNTQFLPFLAELRVVVGFLGEQAQFGWWRSAFFSSSSEAFLTPIFARTKILARCNGVTQAAALVHDERIGVGHVYHLFRLPEDLEQGLYQTLLEPEFGAKLMGLAVAQPEALAWLEQHANTTQHSGAGPVRVAGLADLREPASWREVAGHYWAAFKAHTETLPYFADRG